MIPAADRAARYRAMNCELNRLETIFMKERLVSMPPLVQLSTGTCCNLRCVFCTERGAGTEGFYRDLTLEEFMPLAEGLDLVSTVQLWGWGEPFFNPHYEAIFAYVTERYPGIEINLSTNGTLFDETWQRRLLDYGNTSVNVSVNAASRSIYELVSGRDLFDRVADNLRSFGRLRGEFREKTRSRFTVSCVVIDDNVHEMADFVDFAADVGADHVQFMDLMHLNVRCPAISAAGRGETVRERFAEARQRATTRQIGIGSFLPYAANDYLAMERYGSGIAIAGPDAPVPLQPCYEPWRSVMIGTDGTATLCCRTGAVTGNVRQSGLEAVWNSDVYRAFREVVNSPSPPEACRSCPVKLGMSC
ncbi:MAG: radical SAM protein [Geobacter sp.]|nr:radical SAM protein [Geobacter sp.]